eukprot:3312885-Alexandrium_andersonii.AAC.1
MGDPCQTHRGPPDDRRRLPRPPQTGARPQGDRLAPALLDPAADARHLHHLAKLCHVQLLL